MTEERTDDMRRQLHDFIEQSRWFGGKGRGFEVLGTRRIEVPGEADPDTTAPLGLVTIELVSIRYDDGETDLYQVPMSYYLGERMRLGHALIGRWEDPDLGDVWAYDAMHDHTATGLWLRAYAESRETGELRFHRVGEPEIGPDNRSTILTGEQSNSSVKFGDESLMKVFRRVTPGRNPDIEILTALTEAGNEHAPDLYGWLEAAPEGDGEPLDLGFLQQFLRTASDGWELALVSLRNLFAEADVQAREAGGDFAAEANRLGVALAELHATLAEAFPTEKWDGARLGRLADSMSARLQDAVRVVPELEGHAPALHAIFDAVRHVSSDVVAQRIHGDLHLGQTLRTVKNWKIIDFEGEPAKPLEERRRPDSPWRDVAGMIRSFDYAAELSRLDHEQATGDVEESAGARSREWAARNIAAFITGYREASAADVNEVLLTAYATDKAVYEAVYEARNRPSWLGIPLGALNRLATEA